MKKTSFVIFLCLISNHAFSAPEIKGSPQELRGFLHPTDRLVTINGEAEEKAYSDKAIVSLVISTENKLLSQSMSSNSSLREKITASLMKSGIDADDIKSSKFSSSPAYGWFSDKPSSYKVVNRMAISITQEIHLEKIAAIADNYKQVELSDTAFEHTKKEEYNQKVKVKALANIINQKDFYENALGFKLVAIGIRDSNIRYRATRGALVLDEALLSVVQRRAKISLSSVENQQSSTKAQSQSFDEIKYEANLSVVFKIEQ